MCVQQRKHGVGVGSAFAHLEATILPSISSFSAILGTNDSVRIRGDVPSGPPLRRSPVELAMTSTKVSPVVHFPHEYLPLRTSVLVTLDIFGIWARLTFIYGIMT